MPPSEAQIRYIGWICNTLHKRFYGYTSRDAARFIRRWASVAKRVQGPFRPRRVNPAYGNIGTLKMFVIDTPVERAFAQAAEHIGIDQHLPWAF